MNDRASWKLTVGQTKMIIKSFGIFIVSVFLLFSYLPQSLASEGIILLDENFDAYPFDTHPSSFSTLTSSTNYKASIDSYPSSTDKSLKIERTAASSTSSYINHHFNSSEPLDHIRIRFEAKTEQTDVITYIPVLYGGDGGVITQIAFFNNGYIRAFGPNGWYNIMPYSANLWYSFDLEVDTSRQVFHLKINDDLEIANQPFRTAQTEVKTLRYGIQGGGSATAAYWINNIKVEIPELPVLDTKIFQENFETRSLDTYPSTFTTVDTVSGNHAIVSQEKNGSNPNQVLKIERYAENANTTYFAPISLVEPQTKLLISFDAMVPQTNVVAHIPTIRGSSGPIAQIAFHNTGNIAVFQGGWTPVYTGYEANRWYRFDITVDTTTNTFGLWIDGILIDHNFIFQTNQTAVTKLEFGLFRGTQLASLYLDNIVLNKQTYFPLEDIELEGESQVAINSNTTITLQVEPQNPLHSHVEWIVSNNRVSIINETPRSITLRGLVEGEVDVTAVVTDTVTNQVWEATHQLSVYWEAVQSIEIVSTFSPFELPIDREWTINAQVLPAYASNKAIMWQSSDESIVSINADGMITAHQIGYATITAKTVDGNFSDTIDVTVIAENIQAQLYVSPTGDDTADGTLETPFKTIQRAQQAVRQLLHVGQTGDIIVYLLDGIYELTNTITLDDRDSGQLFWKVIYEGANNTTISGGKEITGWTLYDAEAGIYRAPSHGLQTRQLFVNGVRATLARSEGGLKDVTITSNGLTTSSLELASFAHPEQLEFVFWQIWTQPRARVASIQLNESQALAHVTMQQPNWSAVTNKGSTSVNKSPVYIENAYELLDTAGEWYVDEQYFYYITREDENLLHSEVIVPILEQLMTIEGRSLEQAAHNISFRGITFTYSTWLYPSISGGLPDVQNNILRYPGTDDRLIEGAIEVRRAYNMEFINNVFTKLGSTGLKMEGGIQNTKIEGNHFYDLSSSAATIGAITNRDRQIYAPEDERLQIARISIQNNYIHDIGIDYRSAAAISMGYPIDSQISYNHIFNIPYSGIHIGYGWYSYTSNGVKNLEVNHNYIHDLLGMGLYDGGAIYTVGYHAESPNQYNLAYGNYIQNQMNRTAVLYADNASRYWHFTRNIIDFEDADWDNYQLYWLRGTETELLFDHNYITDGLVHDLYGATIPVFNTYVILDANWPYEAQELIDIAGVQATNYHLPLMEPERLHHSKVINVGINKSEQLEITATKNKGTVASLQGARIFYRSLNEDIAHVNTLGEVFGVAAGIAEIEITVIWQDVKRILYSKVYVGDELSSLSFENVLGSERKLILGESIPLLPYGLTALGQKITFDDVQFHSSNLAVMEVDEEGVVSALSEGVSSITVNASLGNWQMNTVLTFEVIVYSSNEGLEIAPYLLQQQLSDDQAWHVTSGRANDNLSGGIQLATSAGQASYLPRTFKNELLTFDMEINATGGFEVIQIRNQTLSNPLNTTYAIVIKPNEIELQRFNNGQRTVIFGNVGGFTSTGGDAYVNDIVSFSGSRHQIQVGSINEVDGIRIVLNIDGRNIFYYLDKDENRIEQAGYFSIMARYGTIDLYEAKLSTFDVNYEGNGNTAGLPPNDTNAYKQGQYAIVQDGDALTRVGYRFIGWNTQADGNGASYVAGEQLVIAENKMLYAQWQLLPTANQLPAVRAISTNHGHSYGLFDGTFILNSNIWYGENGDTYRLYENGLLIDMQILINNSPSAQKIMSSISGRTNGTYTYIVEMENSLGITRSAPFVVYVTHANPAKGVLSHNNWDRDGHYQLTMNQWWGTNATDIYWYENDVLIESQSLLSQTPHAQSASLIVTGKPAGSYIYRIQLSNAAGTTWSDDIIVIVN